jgi:RNA-directed DNA polymerase
MAAVIVLEAIFEADLTEEQYAYRPKRSAHDAVRKVHELLNRGYTEVVDADLKGYFDTIPHHELMKSVARRVSDAAMLKLVKAWLEMAVEETDERGNKRRTTVNKDSGKGTPQGAPLSPLLANLYMRRFLLGWKQQGWEQKLRAHIVNYADDFVILCRQKGGGGTSTDGKDDGKAETGSKPAKDTHLPCTRRIVRFSGIHVGALLSGQNRPSLYRDKTLEEARP